MYNNIENIPTDDLAKVPAKFVIFLRWTLSVQSCITNGSVELLFNARNQKVLSELDFVFQR